jgi:hypothetical protein
VRAHPCLLHHFPEHFTQWASEFLSVFSSSNFLELTSLLLTTGATIPKDGSDSRQWRRCPERHSHQPQHHGGCSTALRPIRPAINSTRERNYMWYPSSQDFVQNLPLLSPHSRPSNSKRTRRPSDSSHMTLMQWSRRSHRSTSIPSSCNTASKNSLRIIFLIRFSLQLKRSFQGTPTDPILPP